MGVAYIVDKQPIFLTFKNYNFVLKSLTESETTSIEERYAAEISGGKERERLDKKIIAFLSTNKEYINYGNFELEGKEAQEEVSTLLQAYRWVYGGFDFYKFTTTWLNPFGRFAPFEYCSADLHYPYGKQFYITKVSKKQFFKREAEPLIHILIDTEKITYIKGKLSSFEIKFSNDKKMLFFKNQFCIMQ